MNRLKFRAWDKKDKVIRIVYSILFKRISDKGNRDNDTVELHCSNYQQPRAILFSHFERLMEDVVIMQFTGLKDKNGKEIYEGDIANINYTCMRYSHFMKVTDRGVMEWCNKLAQFSFLVKDSILNEDMQDLEIEVIGNIYENPELLEGDGYILKEV